MSGPLTIKLRCASWGQLEQIYQRDLTRGAVFLKSKKPPPLGTKVKINLTLPSETLIILTGRIARHIPAAGLGGRGPGVDIGLDTVPQSAMWLIESALSSAKQKETSAARVIPKSRPPTAPRATAHASAVPPPRPPSSPPAPAEADMDEGASLVAAETELLDALRKEFESLRKLNPFQILGVEYHAGDPEVREAFAHLTKRYHPDRYARFQSHEARELASEVFILIRDAYRRTGSPRAREQSLRSLGREPPLRTPTPAPRRTRTETPAPLPTPPPAPPQKRARPLDDRDDLFDEAAQGPANVSRPLDDAPVRPRASADLVRAEEMVDAGRYQDALAIFTLAARRTPGDLRARGGVELCEGLKALAENDRLEAAQRFEMVLELDPENERAVRELAEMRRQATQDRKGLLARLLGKKE